MAQTNVNIRMDEETKKAFDKFCNEIGLSVSSAFNIFAKTVVREQRIPFELTTEVPNAVTLAAMDDAEKGYVYGPYESIDDLMEALNA
ncbi:MAG: type II toxin-antitoxin system RelB/DinJ family antitoxin [Oscillospiraceae bacterium]|nr:type II toxin-antitoxin system RelB/DinJ family antitoxin [Oscillospiraceae bacterium]